MNAQTRRRGHTTAWTTATVFACTAALAMAACGEAGTAPEEPQGVAPGGGPVSVAGYDYADSQGDPTAAAVIGAYETWDVLPPPVAVNEDFESGAGPFWTYTEAAGSVSLADGALRITNSDPEWSFDSYADLDAAADSVLVSSAFTITEPLQAYEGPGLAVVRWSRDGQEVESQIEFTVDGGGAYLLESTGTGEDARLLDSATVPAGLTGEVDIGLWVFARGETTGAVGYLGGEAIVEKVGATGTFNTVVLRAYSTGTPRTVDFEWAEIRAQAAGQSLPDLFAEQSEHAVALDGAQVATIVVLKPSGYLRDLPQFDTQRCCSVLQGAAPPGMTVTIETVAGEPVVTGDSDGTTFWVWTREDSWSVVTAADPAAGKAFVEAYIAAEHAEGSQVHAAGP